MMPAIRVVSPANYEQNGAGGVGHLSAHSVLQDDLLVLLGAMIRSAVDRLLRRGKHCKLPVSINLRASVNPLKSICCHVDMKYLHQMQGKDKCCYVFVAIDLPPRWVFIATKRHKAAAAAKSSLAAVRKAVSSRYRPSSPAPAAATATATATAQRLRTGCLEVADAALQESMGLTRCARR